MIETTATVTTKGQVTIPVEFRRMLEIRPGDRVKFRRLDDGRIEIARTKRRLEDVFGAVAPKNRPEDFETMIRDAKEERAARTIRKMKSNGLSRGQHA